MTGIEDAVRDAIDRADLATVRRIARLLIDECGYLDQHNPEGDEQIGRFECSGLHYHVPPCGDYTSTAGKCAEGPLEPWCEYGGFDCPTCETVRQLREAIS